MPLVQKLLSLLAFVLAISVTAGCASVDHHGDGFLCLTESSRAWCNLPQEQPIGSDCSCRCNSSSAKPEQSESGKVIHHSEQDGKAVWSTTACY